MSMGQNCPKASPVSQYQGTITGASMVRRGFHRHSKEERQQQWSLVKSRAHFLYTKHRLLMLMSDLSRWQFSHR